MADDILTETQFPIGTWRGLLSVGIHSCLTCHEPVSSYSFLFPSLCPAEYLQ